MTSPHILVVGSANIDLVNQVDVVPRAGETLTGLGFTQSFGGKGANQAAMAALCGAHVIFVARVGDDGFGASWRPHLEAFGIDTSHLLTTQGHPSGIASIWVEASGENRIVLAPGANALLSSNDVDRAIDSCGAIDAVLAQLETPHEATLRAFSHARETGAHTILNPAPAAAISDELISVTDWLLPNEGELRLLAGHKGIGENDTLRLIKAYGNATQLRLAVTLGAEGAAYYDPRKTDAPAVIAALRVTAIDTTGAGDAFAGAFTVAISRRGDDPKSAIAQAVAVASRSVTKRGTTESYPRGRELEDLLSQR